MSAKFSIKPYHGSGLGAQIQQFSFLYTLGIYYGMDYVHVPWDTRRIGSTIYDHIGLNKALHSTYDKNIYHSTAASVNVSDEVLVDPLTNDLSQTFFEQKKNSTANDCIFELSFTTWQKCATIRKLLDYSLSDTLQAITKQFPTFKSITNNHIINLNPNPANLDNFIIVAHIRRGDTAVIEIEGKLFSCWQLQIDSNGKHHISVAQVDNKHEALYPPVELPEYMELFEYCMSVIAKTRPDLNVTLVIISDGFEKSHQRLMENTERLKLSPSQVDAAINSATLEFQEFRKNPAVSELIIGEDENSLKKAIYWIAHADLLITGTGSFASNIKTFFNLKDRHLNFSLSRKGLRGVGEFCNILRDQVKIF